VEIRSAVLRRSPATAPFTASRPLAVERLELAPPGPGEVLVRIAAAGLCHSDLSVVDGNRPRPLPMALGHEAAGTVVEAGPGVHDLAPGDHVVLVYVPSCGRCRFCGGGEPALCEAGAAANGAGELLGGGSRLRDAHGAVVHHHLGVSGFATHAVVDRASAVAVDDDIPLDVAALFGCAMLTGFGAVTRTAGVRPGDSVTVFGLGGVGLAAVMSAAATGAHPVVAVDPVPSKRSLARELGATHSCAPDGVDALLARVSPGGTRFAFEVVGSAAVLEAAYRATGRGGATVAVGLPHPDATVTIPALSLVATNRRLLGSYMGSARPRSDIPVLAGLWRAGRLPVARLASGSVPLDGLNEALDALAGGHAVRQIVQP
jgi:alcohol dehydrogenase